MGCCGQKRAELKQQQISASIHSDQPYQNNSQSRQINKEIRYKYVGSSGKTYTGAITSKKYTFRFKGDICLIDERDAPALSAEPLIQYLPQGSVQVEGRADQGQVGKGLGRVSQVFAAESDLF